MSDHFRIQMTAFPRIDLMSVGTGLANSVGVIAGLLVAFNYANGKIILCRFNRRTEQLPEPGLETKLSAKICFCLKYFLLSLAMALLRARMSSSILMARSADIAESCE